MANNLYLVLEENRGFDNDERRNKHAADWRLLCSHLCSRLHVMAPAIQSFQLNGDSVEATKGERAWKLKARALMAFWETLNSSYWSLAYNWVSFFCRRSIRNACSMSTSLIAALGLLPSLPWSPRWSS